MAIQLVGYASSTQGSAVNLTALSGGIGSAAQAGDFVFVIHGWAGNSNEAPQVTTAGYTNATDVYGDDSTDLNMNVAYKLLTSAETSVQGNVTGLSLSLYGVRTVAFVYRGVDQTNPLEQSIGLGASGANSHIPNPPSRIISTVPALSLAVGGMASTNNNPLSAPTGWTLVEEGVSDFSRRFRTCLASRAISSAGTYDPGAMSTTAADAISAWGAYHVVLREAATSGGVEVGNRNAAMFLLM